jgi:hypothetical protein
VSTGRRTVRLVPELEPLVHLTVTTGRPAIGSSKDTANTPLEITAGEASVLARTIWVARETED